MEVIILKYEKDLTHLRERRDTAIFIGDHQKIRIDTEIEVLERVIADIKNKTENSCRNEILYIDL